MDKLPIMVGLIFAMALGFVAVGQIESLRDIGAPLTSGSFKSLVDTTWFFGLLLVVVLCVGTLAAAAVMVLKGR